MNAEDYKARMDILAIAMRTAVSVGSQVSDEQLDELEKVIGKADGVGMFIVPPIEFPRAMRNLDDARKMIAFHRSLRALFVKLTAESTYPGVIVE